jgi:hypothetical protein
MKMYSLALDLYTVEPQVVHLLVIELRDSHTHLPLVLKIENNIEFGSAIIKLTVTAGTSESSSYGLTVYHWPAHSIPADICSTTPEVSISRTTLSTQPQILAMKTDSL